MTMGDRVGTLHCRYHVHGTSPDPVAVRRMERLAGQLEGELDAALRTLTGDDRSVTVIRSVAAHTTVNTVNLGSNGLASDGLLAVEVALARDWARDLASGVVRAVVDDPGDGRNLCHFDSEAAYVAAFIGDLLQGTAWQHWYYGAFAAHRDAGTAGAVEGVLLEHRDDLPDILAELSRSGALEGVLAMIDPEVLGLRPAGSVPDVDVAEAWHPLLVAAICLLRALGDTEVDQADATALLPRWLRTAPAPPDWGSAAALTDAVVTVVAWLVRHGIARPPSPDAVPGAGTPGSGTGGAGSRRLGDLDLAAAGLTWMETDRLAIGLRTVREDPALALRVVGGATPHQRSLLAAIASAVARCGATLERAVPASAADVVRVVAALSQIDATLASDQATPVLVGELLTAVAALAAAPARGAALRAIAAGDPAALLAATRTGDVQRTPLPPGDPQAALLRMASLGAPAARALEVLVGSTEVGRVVPSTAAGLALLLRAVRDVRLADLARRHDHPAGRPAYLVAAVGLRWAGHPGAAAPLDPAVRVLADLDDGATTAADVATAMATVDLAADAAWRAMIGRDLAARHGVAMDPADPDALHALGDDAIGVTALLLLRIWARWLRGFEHSSATYLLDHFVRRPGTIGVEEDAVVVRMPRRPLDTVLEIAGYLQPIEPLPGSGGPRARFEVHAP